MDSILNPKLKPEYAEKQYCKLGAGASVGGLVADAVGNEAGEGLLDTWATIALMKCVGTSNWAIAAYYLALLCVLVLCIVLIPMAIPDSAWENCSLCEEFSRSNDECVRYKKGSPAECRESGRWIEYFIGTAVGLAIVSTVYWFVLLYLKHKVYTSEAFYADLFLGIAL